MAIKLYKSQLTPSSKSSNVMDTRQVSMSEAASIGQAWKGMVNSGEKLYTKHLDIKSDNELLEKAKEVMNGNDNFEGLSATSLYAKEMNDPDKAVAHYNNSWKTLLDTQGNNLSWMGKRKFKSWMNKQNLKDVNTIKTAATTNMINGLRANTIDQIEILKKSILYSTGIEQQIAKKELNILFNNKKTKDLFGATLDKTISDTNTEIAFFQYKNVPAADQKAALEAAKKDPNIPNDGKYSIDALTTAFKTASATNNYLNKDNVSKMETNMENGISINTEEFSEAAQIALDNNDQATLLKLNQIKIDAPIYAQLSKMTVAEIENRVNILTEYSNTKKDGMELEYANNLNISKKYLSALSSSLDKDILTTANDRGIVTIDEIGFEKLLATGDVSEFAEAINNRVAKAETAAFFYKRPVQFFTANEVKAIEGAFENATTANEIINISTALVKGFGAKSDTAFKQLSKDNTILSTIGGLTIMNDGVAGKNVQLAVQGYINSKNEQFAKVYKMKSNDTSLLKVIGKYEEVFKQNEATYGNIIETANYIYASQLKNSGKTTNDFKSSDWEKALIMAAGGNEIEKFGFDTKMGGFDKDTRENKVHIPPWLKRGKFKNVIKMFNKNIDGRKLFKKASSNGENAVSVDGEELKVFQIFKEQDPYFVTAGNGKYKIAMGENPNEFGSEPEWLMNSDGGYFILNLNKIKAEIITGL